jgi:hypothetical protein
MVQRNLNGQTYCLVVICAFFSTWLTTQAQTTFNVNSHATLSSAISSSVNGDIINFTSDIVVNSELTISGKTLTMNGNNYEISVPVPGLDNMGRFNTSPSSFRVFNFSSSANITINNLTIKGGSTSSSGGAIVVGSGCILNLNNSIVTNSRVSGFAGGGGIAIFGTLFMRNSFIRRNAAHYGGGILVSNSAKAFVEQSTLIENRSTASNGGGGAAECQFSSLLIFNNSTLSNNQSTEIGGAINNYQGTVYFINSSATGNVAFGSFKGGALGNNGGNLWIVNSLFAHNYRRTTGTVTNPTGYILDDFEPHSSPGNVRVIHSIYHATLPTGLGQNISNVQYTGLADGSNNTIFSGGLLSKITDNDGNEIGDQIFRPFLVNNSGSTAPTLQVGSFVSQPANRGVPTRFNNGGGTPRIGYFSSSTWTNITGTTSAGDLVTVDQVNAARNNTTPSSGAIESELNATLYIVKVNGATGGTVNGGTIYGDVYPSGTSVTLTAIPATGQQFLRWDYVAGGTGTASTANPYTFTVTQNVTLVPVFQALTPGQYAVTYIGNGHTGGIVPASGIFSAPTTIAGAGTMVQSGFSFTGWNTNSNGAGTAYAAGAAYSAGSNLTLYAQWQALPVSQWTGNTNTQWNEAGNWTPAIPVAGQNILIPTGRPNYPVLEMNPTVGDLEIQTGASVSIPSNQHLTVDGLLTNNGTLTVQNDGALVQGTSSTLAGSGTYSVKRNLPSTDKFHYVGSPINSIATNSFGISPTVLSGSNGSQLIPQTTCDINALDASSPWANILELRENASVLQNCSQSLWHVKSSGNLENGRGYAVMAYGAGSVQNLSFDGTINNGSISYGSLGNSGGTITDPISGTISRGWHLVTNPYPSPITFGTGNTVLTNLGFDAQVQVWNAATGTWIPNVSNAVIPVGQGFQIRNSGATSLSYSLNNGNRTTTSATFYSTPWNEYLTISLENQLHSMQTVVFFHPDATDGYDGTMEANRLFGGANIPVIYTLAGADDKMAFNGYAPLVNETKTVILGVYDGASPGDYTLRFQDLITLQNMTVMLEDTKLNTFTVVSENLIYPFTIASNDERNRFKLHFNATTTGQEMEGESAFIVYPNPTQEVVHVAFTDLLTNHQLRLMDVSGKCLQTHEVVKGEVSYTIPTSSLSTGVYLLHITSATGKSHVVKLIKQ